MIASLIITTYNWPSALRRVFAALACQTYPHFEVIIADDGSTQETYECIQQARNTLPFDILHVYQPDEGFQVAKIRNKAVTKARGEYLIFLDGDCIPMPKFIERHVRLAEKGWFVAGNRILLAEKYTAFALEHDVSLHRLNFQKWCQLKLQHCCNRVLPLLFLALFPRKLQPFKWQGAKTCNLGVWKEDFIKVNGFDESFRGWGYEDSDLVIRLIKSGIKRKEGRFALPVVHLWHKENDRSSEDENYVKLRGPSLRSG